jgi:pentatricopeptide repeat protein
MQTASKEVGAIGEIYDDKQSTSRKQCSQSISKTGQSRRHLVVEENLESRTAAEESRCPRPSIECSPSNSAQLVADSLTRHREATPAISLTLDNTCLNQKRRIYRESGKYVRFDPKKDQNFSTAYGSWHSRFAAINSSRTHLFGSNGKDSTRHHDTEYKRFVKQHGAEILDMAKNASPSLLRQYWASLPRQHAEQMWMEVMMTTLECYPTRALGVLAATYMKPYPPLYAVKDSLEYIINHFAHHTKLYPQQYHQDLAQNIFYLLLETPGKELRFSQHSLWLLLSHIDQSHLKRLYEIMLQIHHTLHENTLIQFSYRFAKNGQTDVAFEVLQRLSKASFNTPKMLALCTTLLSRTHRDPGAIYSETVIFEFMINCGLTPNTITHNVLMWNSINAGDHKTAWQIHDMMSDAGIEPSSSTYSILLSDAKKRMDVTDIRRVMSIVREKKIVSSRLVTDVLHAIFLLHKQRTDEMSETVRETPLSALRRMLPVYCENFQLGHLAQIIPEVSHIIPDIMNSICIGHSEELESALMVPHDGVLMVMLTAYLSAIQNPESAVQFYHHFRHLVYQGEPAVKSLTATTHVWNLILMTFGKFPTLVPECAHLIGDMVTPEVKQRFDEALLPPSEGHDREAPSKLLNIQLSRPSHGTPQPDLFTWSILLKIFTDHKQASAAEQVLTMMKERGIEPSIITWNTLTNGYVALQDTNMAADTVHRLEEAGLSVNESTLSTLSKLRSNRERFLFHLADKKKKKRVKEALQVHLDEMALLEKDEAAKRAYELNKDDDEWLEQELVEDQVRQEEKNISEIL